MGRFCKAYVDGRAVDVYCAGSWIPTIDKHPVLWIWDATTHELHQPSRNYPDSPAGCFAVGHGMRFVTQAARQVEVPGGQRTVAVGHDECVAWLAKHAIQETIASPFVLAYLKQAKACVAAVA